VDANSDTEHMYAPIETDATAQPSVALLPRRPCAWGTFGTVDATLDGIRQALCAPFDHLTLLTGQDYPVKPASWVASFLDDNRGVSFVEYSALPIKEWRNGGLDRVEYRYRPDLSRSPDKRPVPRDIRLYGGLAQW